MYLFFRQFLVQNALQNLLLPVAVIALPIFNVAVLLLFTDGFTQMYSIGRFVSVPPAMPRVSHKRQGRLFAVTVLCVAFFGGGVLWYQSLHQVTSGVSVHVPLAVKPSPSQNVSTEFPADFFTSTATGTQSAILSNTASQTGVTVNNGAPIISQTKTIGSVYRFYRYLGIGDTGKDVVWLQSILKSALFYTGAVTGTFDSTTAKALSLFIQQKTGTKTIYMQLGPKALTIFKSIKIE